MKKQTHNYLLAQVLQQQGNQHLQQLLRKSQQLRQLEHLVKACLPQKLRRHCRVSDLRDTTLFLSTDSASWNTVLRYEQEALLSALNQYGTDVAIRQIVCQVKPHQPVGNESSALPQPTLSANSARFLQEVAQHTPDPKLANIYSKIANSRKE